MALQPSPPLQPKCSDSYLLQGILRGILQSAAPAASPLLHPACICSPVLQEMLRDTLRRMDTMGPCGLAHPVDNLVPGVHGADTGNTLESHPRSQYQHHEHTQYYNALSERSSVADTPNTPTDKPRKARKAQEARTCPGPCNPRGQNPCRKPYTSEAWWKKHFEAEHLESYKLAHPQLEYHCPCVPGWIGTNEALMNHLWEYHMVPTHNRSTFHQEPASLMANTSHHPPYSASQISHVGVNPEAPTAPRQFHPTMGSARNFQETTQPMYNSTSSNLAYAPQMFSAAPASSGKATDSGLSMLPTSAGTFVSGPSISYNDATWTAGHHNLVPPNMTGFPDHQFSGDAFQVL